MASVLDSYRASRNRARKEMIERKAAAYRATESAKDELRAAGADERTVDELSLGFQKAYYQGGMALSQAVGVGVASLKGNSFKSGANTASISGSAGLASSANSTTGARTTGARSTSPAPSSMDLGTLITPSVVQSVAKAKAKEAYNKGQAQVNTMISGVEKKIDTEIKAQPALQEIRRKRQSLVEMEAKALTRKTGRRALLTSAPGGGSGFYGGYFNGK